MQFYRLKTKQPCFLGLCEKEVIEMGLLLLGLIIGISFSTKIKNLLSSIFNAIKVKLKPTKASSAQTASVVASSEIKPPAIPEDVQ